jgi:hypothetical protein
MAELLAWGRRPIVKLGAALSLTILLLSLTFVPLHQRTALARPELQPSIANNLISPPVSTVGEVLARVECSDGYTPTIFVEGLSSPHGLAFSPDGALHVSESNPDRVSRIGANGSVTPIITSIVNPEGIAFDKNGNLYVVEDRNDGRLRSRTPGGTLKTVATGLDAPEDVLWVDDGSAAGLLYVVESNIQHAMSISSPLLSDYATYLTRVTLTGSKTRVLTTVGQINVITQPTPAVNAFFWSYSSLTLGADNFFYLANELSDRTVSGIYQGIPYQASSTDSIFRVNLAVLPTTAVPFVDDTLRAPEGLAFSAGGNFPLYVVEESLGSGNGRLNRVDGAGNPTPFCTGFEELEDVTTHDGDIYVAEDQSGLIIRISNKAAPPPPPPPPPPQDTGVGIWLPLIIRRPA